MELGEPTAACTKGHRAKSCKRQPIRFLTLLCTTAACLLPQLAQAGKQTVCTININSSDEKEAFRRYLPADKYQFVELVERNRPDWLGSAREAKVSCNLLVISGHHGEGNVFFSDAVDNGSSLYVGELERVSCSASCPSLFAKQVYLFGCNTPNPLPQHEVSCEIARSFERGGRSPAQAAQLARRLNVERGESSRDRMRLVFRDVPVIHGFLSATPLGPAAASVLDPFFRSGGAPQIGRGQQASNGLPQYFAPQGMAAVRGMKAGDSLQSLRQDVCETKVAAPHDAGPYSTVRPAGRRHTSAASLPGPTNLPGDCSSCVAPSSATSISLGVLPGDLAQFPVAFKTVAWKVKNGALARPKSKITFPA